MRKKIILILLSTALIFNSSLLKSQDLDSLKTEIQTLKEQLERVEKLQKELTLTADNSSDQKKPNDSTSQILEVPKSDIRETTKYLTGSELVDDDFPGSWPLFGTKFRMKIGGYVKADFLYDLDGTLDKTQFLISTIPVPGMLEYDNGGYIYFFANESRINLDVRRVEKDKLPMRLFVEGDFFSAAGAQFRLRQAFISAGNVTAGQTWTTLTFLESIPFMIDFAAGDALFGGRTALIRYQFNMNEKLKLAAAAEYLSFQGIENPDTLFGESNPQWPLFALRAEYRWKTGVFFLGTSMAQLRWDGGSRGPTATALQYDFIFAGRQYLGTNNYFTWNISYGRGSGENILAFAGSKANAVIDSSGSLKTIPAFAIVLGFMHKWNEQFSSNLSYAYGWLEKVPNRAPFALQDGGIGHINLIWQLNDKLSTGIEYMWGARRSTNDSLGRAQRIQFMTKFDF